MIILRKKMAGISAASLSRFLRQAQQAIRTQRRTNVLVTSSRELRLLNRRFRGKDRATDVLSFPPLHAGSGFSEGDIAISAEIAAANARRLGHPISDEIKVLVLHGLLHLAGYDHETDHGRMARAEARLRRELNLPVTLIGRSTAPAAAELKSRKRSAAATTRARSRR